MFPIEFDQPMGPPVGTGGKSVTQEKRKLLQTRGSRRTREEREENQLARLTFSSNRRGYLSSTFLRLDGAFGARLGDGTSVVLEGLEALGTHSLSSRGLLFLGTGGEGERLLVRSRTSGGRDRSAGDTDTVASLDEGDVLESDAGEAAFREEASGFSGC